MNIKSHQRTIGNKSRDFVVSKVQCNSRFDTVYSEIMIIVRREY